tara:strand:+ start:2236 stop:2817 length:582 start_codon:yes stop_codon:yes gene_type:complete
MNDQILKTNWKALSTNSIRIETEQLIKELQQGSIYLEKKITFRDFTEISVALLLIILFGITAFLIPFLLSKIGSMIIILSCVLIIFRFKNLKDKFTPVTLSDTHTVYLKKTRYYLKEQIKFLDNVIYWYIIPPTSGIILFFAGFGVDTFQFYLLSGITFCLGFRVYILNKYVVKKELIPRLHSINSMIEELLT